MSRKSFKKIVLVIVEGYSDYIALGSPLIRIFNLSDVKVEVVHKDITSDNQSISSNIVKNVASIIKNFLNRNKGYIKKGDIAQIIHVVDMDGAYIPDESIIDDASKKEFFYTTQAILSDRPDKVKERNQRKRACLGVLSKMPKIMDISYGVYYMSCCLDHVLFDKLNLTGKEKTQESGDFAIKCQKGELDFRGFICQSPFSVSGEYRETWTFIQKGLNSLNRYTNLGCAFPGDVAENTSLNQNIIT